MKKPISMALAGVMLATGATISHSAPLFAHDSTVAAQDSHSQSALDMNSKSLYKALFFATGDGVQTLTDTLDDPKYDEFASAIDGDPEVDKTAEDVVERILEDSPNFLDDFRSNITSGDAYKAEEAVIEASELTNEKLDDIYQEELEANPELKDKLGEDINAAADADPASPIVVAAAAVAVAVVVVWSAGAAVNYAAAVNVGAAVNVTVKMNLDKSNSAAAAAPESRNEFEQRVANLTTALAGK
ncbi:hypothetical protein [Brevibacterium luteolum]|uniref:hypothetical protein n=1 Tax=Brevibacterium luteolum TaxID=199591 RepID=UPI00223C449C|nr:hypothetical protein [Brevibacterium luteolum]MCT1656894.1 hypothetical protein [Brevibacterium luteolum]